MIQQSPVDMFTDHAGFLIVGALFTNSAVLLDQV